MKNKIIKKAVLGLSAIGPGLFLIGYNIGTGSVTTMARTGANYGMELSWVLLLSCIFTYILMVAYGKTTLVTGKTALYNIKNNFSIGKPLAIYILIALVIGELLALMGIFGIVADLVREGIVMIGGGEGPDTLWITMVMVVLLYMLFWKGQYKTFEKFLVILVIIMAMSFILVFFMVKPSLLSIVKGMIPSIPEGKGSFQLVAAIAGTTCSAAVFVMRSTVVAEKGWDVSNLKTEKKDSAISAAMMFFLSFIIMAVSAGTLNVMGLSVEKTVDMISLFEPIGGKVAAFVLILGIAGAGISSAFPIILIAPWLICDYTGKKRDIHSPMFRILGLTGLLIGLGSQFVKTTPPLLMVGSQAFQALILPAVAIPVFILMNRKSVMGNHIADIKMNVGLVCVMAFSLITGYFAIADFFA